MPAQNASLKDYRSTAALQAELVTTLALITDSSRLHILKPSADPTSQGDSPVAATSDTLVDVN